MQRNTIVLLVAALSGCLEAQQIPGDGVETEQPDPSTSPRVADGLQVLYTFDEGKGLEVKDTSGVDEPFNLELDNLVNNKWIPGGGIEIVGPSLITSTDVAEKVFASCVQANAVSIELWLEPANLEQQGTVFTYSKQGQRNVSFSMSQSRYAGSVRTSREDPMLPGEVITNIETVQTPENVALTRVQHLVYTRDVTGAAVYLDGVDTKPPSTQPTSPTEPVPTTDQNEWSPAYQIAFGNETNNNSPWLGKIYMAAIYCKRLTTLEVQKNFAVGPDF